MVNQPAAAIGLGQFGRGVDGLVIFAKGGVVNSFWAKCLRPALRWRGTLAAELISGLQIAEST